ncbi:hypothetical protein LZQ00_05885 [Sphingobacterium sp. SRCM116780]|uniref:hypothetical protein n=1 Tax=Sphingobacterium sp. SRCM116780 TaxID=2907623 RepID=UPI001F2B94C6|nr:hypothetical protein [Sphingobacterium sp. SRCM116780]UIR57345.1 hypothetical protein LZQ00_05885 [Sphingobacterium sp. SRCM116780]
MIFRIADRKKLLLTVLPLLGILTFVIIRYIDLDWITSSGILTKTFGIVLLIICLSVIVFFSKKYGVDYEFKIDKGQLYITKNKAHYRSMPIAQLVMLKVFENNDQYFIKLFDANGKKIFAFNNVFTKIPLADVISFFETHIPLLPCNEEYAKLGGKKIDYINKKYMK